MPDIGGRARGDELVEVVVETPRHLTARQEELLREFAEIEHEQVSPGARASSRSCETTSPRRPSPTTRASLDLDRGMAGPNWPSRDGAGAEHERIEP